MSTPSPLIGGIPARLWLGRPVRIRNREHHMARAILLSLSRDTALVKFLPRHRRPEEVPLSIIYPWWSKSPDLHPPRRKKL